MLGGEGLGQVDGAALAPWLEVAALVLGPHSVNDRLPRQFVHSLLEPSLLGATHSRVLCSLAHCTLDHISHDGQGRGLGGLPCEPRSRALQLALRTPRRLGAAGSTEGSDGAEEGVDGEVDWDPRVDDGLARDLGSGGGV